jgi:TonB family protein
MAAGVQGVAYLKAIVEGDGTVGEVRVVRSLAPDLDAEAEKAIKQFRFEPGTLLGQPTPIITTFEMEQ